MAKSSPLYKGDKVLVALGQAIRKLRLESGFSQESLALNSGLDRSYVGSVERGENNITIMNLIKIADALGIKTSELLKFSKN
jgi:transcriptional regulator with XRE-family HTH domain